MTVLLTADIEGTSGDPLELIEELALANDWSSSQTGDDELTLRVPGAYGELELKAVWRPEERVLQLVCLFYTGLARERLPAIYEALALANERLWLGHFECWSDEAALIFRHAVALESADGIGGEHLALLLQNAFEEVERFHPFFSFVADDGRAPLEALEAAMLETEGSA
ncbi:MAG: hypothetical protein KatS3mg119_1831 [Rhodothalassiaceae bacterium]|nr:MAG: hypothetical protein KatS3mg119_1831 [Rhodothalassiaceae bacterium]